MPRVATGKGPFGVGAKAPEPDSEEVRRRNISEAQAFLERALAPT